MLDPNKVKIGIAIAWTEDDMPEMGAENSFLQTISEIALTGYVGTEIGCQYPRDPSILNKEFGRRGISAITAWISTYLNEQPLWWNERAFVDHMNFLSPSARPSSTPRTSPSPSNTSGTPHLPTRKCSTTMSGKCSPRASTTSAKSPMTTA